MDAKALAAALGSISSGHVQMQRPPGPSLADVLTPDVFENLLREPGVLERLAPHLPVRDLHNQSPATCAGSCFAMLFALVFWTCIHIKLRRKASMRKRCALCCVGRAQE